MAYRKGDNETARALSGVYAYGMALTDAPQEPVRAPGSILRKLLPLTTVGVIIAALYVAWTFYSRHESDVAAQQAAAAKEQARRERTVHAVFGSGEILFTGFSADSGLLKKGEHTQLCYGVENAQTVKLDPPVAAVKPTYHTCIQIEPKATTKYTISADDGKGHTKSESLTVRVD
ncbi:MAG: hypothetical protein M3Y72_12575 [Acidobacteriota bacterium]|nr:hypothetical protein [Acidobacteriota bacterium]